MRASVIAACLLAIAGCANTGVVPMDAGTFLIAKREPQFGFGPPVALKGEAYTEANAHCAKQGKGVETVRLTETPSGFGRQAAVQLEFRCQ